MPNVRDWIEDSYEIEHGPPRMTIESYLETRVPEYLELLGSDPPEEVVQRFLERNPAFVHAAVNPMSTHQGFRGLVISKPSLPGFSARIPDFMVIRSNSLNWYPTLIEIERPGKRLFTARRTPTADFSQARHQLTEWNAWLSTPPNEQLFLDEYGISARILPRSQNVSIQRLLIYGRRQEWNDDSDLSLQRSLLIPGPPEALASFDRLGDEVSRVIRLEYDAITVKALGKGRFQALHITPTFALSPASADRLLYIDGLEDAIDANPDLETDRKEFLKRRAAYWRDWAASPGAKVIRSGDVE